MQPAVTCKNCGRSFTGKYCNHCGEKVYTDEDKKFSHFVHESFHFATHLDTKFFKSLFLIFKRPGQLSVDYTSGIRKKYFPPTSLFLVGVILYLLLPLFQGLNMKFEYTLHNFRFANLHLAERLAQAKAASKGISLNELAKLYDAKSAAFAKVLLLLILPLSGFALRLLFAKQRRYFFDHFVLSTELNTFYLYFTFFILSLVSIILHLLIKWLSGTENYYLGDLITMPAYLIAMATVSVIAFKKFYGISRRQAIGKSLLYLLLHSIIVYIIYRFILFLVTLLFI